MKVQFILLLLLLLLFFRIASFAIGTDTEFTFRPHLWTLYHKGYCHDLELCERRSALYIPNSSFFFASYQLCLVPRLEFRPLIRTSDLFGSLGLLCHDKLSRCGYQISVCFSFTWHCGSESISIAMYPYTIYSTSKSLGQP